MFNLEQLPPEVSRALFGFVATVLLGLAGFITWFLRHSRHRMERAEKRIADAYEEEKQKRKEANDIENASRRVELEKLKADAAIAIQMQQFLIDGYKDLSRRSEKQTDDLIGVYKEKAEDRKEIAQLVKANVELDHHNKELTGRVEGLEARQRERHALLDQAHVEVQEAGVKQLKAEKERDAAVAALTTANQEINRLNGEVQVLKQEVAQLKQEVEALKSAPLTESVVTTASEEAPMSN